jgi:hypothetical protein
MYTLIHPKALPQHLQTITFNRPGYTHSKNTEYRLIFLGFSLGPQQETGVTFLHIQLQPRTDLCVQ